MAGAAASDSPAARFVPDRVADSLVRSHESKGLFLPARFAGVGAAASLLVDRVVRLVSGGDAGAYFGASGVRALSSLALTGVLTGAGAEGSSASEASLVSSTSVAASSSSSICLVFGVGALVGKSSLGLMEDRVSGLEK